MSRRSPSEERKYQRRIEVRDQHTRDRREGRDAAASLDPDEQPKRQRVEEEASASAGEQVATSEADDKPGEGFYYNSSISRPGVDQEAEDAKTKRYLARKVSQMLENKAPPQEYCDLLLEHDMFAKWKWWNNRPQEEINWDTERFARPGESDFVLSLLPYDVTDSILRHLWPLAEVDIFHPNRWRDVIDSVGKYIYGQPLDDATKRVLVQEWTEFKRGGHFRHDDLLCDFLEERQWQQVEVRLSRRFYTRFPRRREVEFLLQIMSTAERGRVQRYLSNIGRYDSQYLKGVFNAFQASRSAFLVSNVASGLHFGEQQVPADIIGMIASYVADKNLPPSSIRFREPKPTHMRLAIQLRNLANQIEKDPNADKAAMLEQIKGAIGL